jgi:hypothetical protein
MADILSTYSRTTCSKKTVSQKKQKKNCRIGSIYEATSVLELKAIFILRTHYEKAKRFKQTLRKDKSEAVCLFAFWQGFSYLNGIKVICTPKLLHDFYTI